MNISTNSITGSSASRQNRLGSLAAIKRAPQKKSLVFKKKTKSSRASTYISYVAIIALIFSIVSVGYESPIQEESASAGLSRAAMASTRPSVDQVAAAELAAEAAMTADLAVAANVANLSISLNAKSELAQIDENMLSKPQIVQDAGSGRGFKEYKAVAGDTVQTVAAQYGVSEDSVRWSNNLASDAISEGKVLLIPGSTGIVYTVKSGDTPEKLAQKYRADTDRIVTYNDAEIAGLQPGQRIVIPDGIVPETERPGYVPPAPTPAPRPSAPAAPSYGNYYANAGASVGNRYAYGNCTWYAYERRAELGRPIGSFWGNAVTWKSYAQSAGYHVNRTPAPGAILHDPYSAPPYGHVAIVEQVHADGSIRISEMNYVGFNIISGRTISAGQAASYSYIH